MVKTEVINPGPNQGFILRTKHFKYSLLDVLYSIYWRLSIIKGRRFLSNWEALDSFKTQLQTAVKERSDLASEHNDHAGLWAQNMASVEQKLQDLIQEHAELGRASGADPGSRACKCLSQVSFMGLGDTLVKVLACPTFARAILALLA
ncbi:MAG: hypothetical protein Q9213_005429 [Squamulea squamosa]